MSEFLLRLAGGRLSYCLLNPIIGFGFPFAGSVGPGSINSHRAESKMEFPDIVKLRRGQGGERDGRENKRARSQRLLEKTAGRHKV